MKLEYSGKTALITGGNCECALETASMLIEAGIFVFIGFRSKKALYKINEKLQDYSGKYKECRIDFDETDSLNELTSIKDFSPDFLIDFAQGNFEALTASFDENEAEKYFKSNIFSRSLLIKKVSRLMVGKKYGRMIFISSTAAFLPATGQGFYSASKNACESLYKNCGLEMGRKGIRTIILRPGYINSGRGKFYLEKNSDKIKKKIPTRQFIEPSEVASSIMFFLSDAAAGFNACTITLDGGLTAGKDPVN